MVSLIWMIQVYCTVLHAVYGVFLQRFMGLPERLVSELIQQRHLLYQKEFETS
jgi:hypothetical protein